MNNLVDEPAIGKLRKRVAELASGIGDEALNLAAQTAEGEATEGVYRLVFGPGEPIPAREARYRELITTVKRIGLL